MLPIDIKIVKIVIITLFLKNKKLKIIGNEIKKLIIEVDSEVLKFLFCLLSYQFLSSLSF